MVKDEGENLFLRCRLCSEVTQALLHCSLAASVHSIQLQAAVMGDHVLICV